MPTSRLYWRSGPPDAEIMVISGDWLLLETVVLDRLKAEGWTLIPPEGQ